MNFENLQIEVPNLSADELPQNYGVKVYEKKYHNNADFIIGFDPNSKEAEDQRKKREQRFGVKNLECNSNAMVDTFIANKLGNFEDINLEKLNWPGIPKDSKNEIRQDAILLYGVNNMSTKDVFNYFNLYGPENLEWIDDYSCNVVWENEKLVLQAMDCMSKTYTMLRQLQNDSRLPDKQVIIKEEPDDEVLNDAVLVEDDEYDPKDVWRIARPYHGDQLFMRHATISDKKLPRAAERSEYYLKYGKNPFATKSGIGPGILSKSRKRKLERMKAIAEQRFKDNIPDVKIIALADLKQEGIIPKIEADYSEPVVKRLNFHSREDSINNTMSMVADKVELENRFGKKDNTVKDRLGLLGSFTENSIQENLSLLNHHKKTVHDRLGNRDNWKEKDARLDINFSRQKRSDVTSNNGNYGNERVQSNNFSKKRLEDDYIRNRNKHDEYQKSSNEVINQSGVRDRLSTTSSISDLRNKLQKVSKRHLSHQGHEEDEKLNLCIEIKQEPEEIEMMEFEF